MLFFSPLHKSPQTNLLTSSLNLNHFSVFLFLQKAYFIGLLIQPFKSRSISYQTGRKMLSREDPSFSSADRLRVALRYLHYNHTDNAIFLSYTLVYEYLIPWISSFISTTFLKTAIPNSLLPLKNCPSSSIPLQTPKETH